LIQLYKIIIVVLLTLTNLFSSSLENKLIKDIYYSIDKNSYQNINTINDFSILNNKKVFLKIELNNSIINKEKKYYLKLDTNAELLNSSSLYEKKDLYDYFINLDNKALNLIFELDFTNKSFYLNIEILNDFSYRNFYKNKNSIFGFIYGIIFCAILYNLIYYLFNKQKAFLYYVLFEIFIFCFLLLNTFPIFILNLFNNYSEFIIIFSTIILNLTFIFAFLFNIEFLDIKKLSPKLYKFFKTLIFILLIDFIFIFSIYKSIFIYIPYYLFIFLLFSSAIYIYFKGNKSVIFYIFSWLILFLIIFIIENDFINLNETYLLHIGIALESLIFTATLSYKIKQNELEKIKYEQLLIHKTKLSSMGEMIGNIAHQWRQPLTHLSLAIMNLKNAYISKKLTLKYFDNKMEEINSQLNFMSQTIEDFQDFFKKNKIKKDFYIFHLIKNLLKMFGNSLNNLNITYNFSNNEDIKINSFENEFQQVILNILTNANQIAIERRVKNAQINFRLIKKNQGIVLIISDNLGGTKNIKIDKIFDPYFSTKKNGLGIGLYMSGIIIKDHMKGSISAINIPNGLKFEIFLPFKIDNP
jgi:signal transduction histidine kinase